MLNSVSCPYALKFETINLINIADLRFVYTFYLPQNYDIFVILQKNLRKLS